VGRGAALARSGRDAAARGSPSPEGPRFLPSLASSREWGVARRGMYNCPSPIQVAR
jgi:hypothetical protein